MIVRRSERPGYVLIAVMVVVVVLSYTSYRYLDSMTTEYTLAVRNTEQVPVHAPRPPPSTPSSPRSPPARS